ncbi:hypothetical protein SAMN05421504_103260 [Amycolatopsis xylanica]|uniref:Uncharacterized protein n=1 Tax=Amycolatopsis xylanica TaxID=589385 RepID=A0A1H3D6X5_9PSEU|nr:hypothetical protein SAMN05421504_103260 [Amycolatopsis xylanica]
MTEYLDPYELFADDEYEAVAEDSSEEVDKAA